MVGTLAYLIEPNALTVILRDDSGWLKHDPSPAEVRWPKAVPAAKFDAISMHDSGDSVTLTKLFEDDAPASND